jgi:DNA (cytosine-5)-methyltransferase 1
VNHFSLFTGVGGIDLAAEWAGFTTVGQVEMADYPTKILEKHWPNVPRWRDIRDVTTDSFRERTGLSTVDLISGGFPCQPFSLAGERKGEDDDRYLWPEMLRIINQLRPTWVLGENVVGFITLGLDQALSDLESIGYKAVVFDIPACAIDADIERRRIFIVAHTYSERLQGGQDNGSGRASRSWSAEQLSRLLSPGPWTHISAADFGRENTRIPNRVDRTHALGNAVVPQQCYPILKAIYNIEKESRK